MLEVVSSAYRAFKQAVAPSAEPESKPVVTYRLLPMSEIVVGFSAYVVTLNHPARGRVTPGEVARTGTVISYDPMSREFETKRTRYVVEKH